MLGLASKFARYQFGQVAGVEVGIPAEGHGYTRVVIAELDAHGQPSASPIHLHVETVDEPGSPDSLSAVLEYDREGTPVRLVMTEYGDHGYSMRVECTVNEKSDKFSVRKVERVDSYAHTKSLLYKRGWEPPQDGRGPSMGRGTHDGRGTRDDRRGGGRGSWDRGGRERQGRDWRDERGGRGAGDWGGRGEHHRGWRDDERDDWRGRDDRRGGRGDWRAERDRAQRGGQRDARSDWREGRDRGRRDRW